MENGSPARSTPRPIDRSALLALLTTMDREVFEYFALWANGARVSIPPLDQLGGYRPDQRAQIVALHAAARQYLDRGERKHGQ